jgi:hypothetical protein
MCAPCEVSIDSEAPRSKSTASHSEGYKGTAYSRGYERGENNGGTENTNKRVGGEASSRRRDYRLTRLFVSERGYRRAIRSPGVVGQREHCAVVLSGLSALW